MTGPRFNPPTPEDIAALKADPENLRAFEEKIRQYYRGYLDGIASAIQIVSPKMNAFTKVNNQTLEELLRVTNLLRNEEAQARADFKTPLIAAEYMASGKLDPTVGDDELDRKD